MQFDGLIDGVAGPPAHGQHLKSKGLDNIDFSCFLNAVLQCLIRMGPWNESEDTTSPTRNRFDNVRLRCLATFSAMRSHIPDTVTVNCLQDLRLELGVMDADLRTGQADAAQVALLLLQALQEPMPEESWPVRSPIFTTLTCTQENCGGKSIHAITGTMLEVEIGQASSTLVQCLENTFANCTVEHTCDTCKVKQTNVVKTTDLVQAPPILMLRLLRTPPGSHLTSEKNTARVTYPKELDLSPFLLDRNTKAMYDLSACVNHEGPSILSGHFTAIVQSHSDTWHHCNDKSVEEARPVDFDPAKVYILFYTRRKDTHSDLQEPVTVADAVEAVIDDSISGGGDEDNAQLTSAVANATTGQNADMDSVNNGRATVVQNSVHDVMHASNIAKRYLWCVGVCILSVCMNLSVFVCVHECTPRSTFFVSKICTGSN
jgi:hypothetical protein